MQRSLCLIQSTPPDSGQSNQSIPQSYYHEAVAELLNNKLYLTPVRLYTNPPPCCCRPHPNMISIMPHQYIHVYTQDVSSTPVAAVVRKYFRVPEAFPLSPSPSRRRQRARGVGVGQEEEGQQQPPPQGTSVGDRLDAGASDVCGVFCCGDGDAARWLIEYIPWIKQRSWPCASSQGPGPASRPRFSRTCTHTCIYVMISVCMYHVLTRVNIYTCILLHTGRLLHRRRGPRH